MPDEPCRDETPLRFALETAADTWAIARVVAVMRSPKADDAPGFALLLGRYPLAGEYPD